MTGSSHPDIDALLTLWNTNKRDRALALVQGNGALLAQVRAEIARLEESGGKRTLLEMDEVSRQVHRVLKALIAANDVGVPEPEVA